MKKIMLLLALLCCLAGCGKYNKEDIINKFSKNVDNTNSYHITGNLEIYRDEELYTYIIDSSFQKEDNFRVSLTNQTNNHEQIILKNKEGVYVITHKSTNYSLISLKNSSIGISKALDIIYKNSKLNV